MCSGSQITTSPTIVMIGEKIIGNKEVGTVA
jgi:hypothetical protein